MSTPTGFTLQFFELLKVSSRLTQEITEELGLTRTQLRALYMAREMTPCTMSDIKDDIDLTTGAITRLIDRLEDLGLVRRVPCHDDRRVIHIALTPAGQERLHVLSAAWERKLSDLLSRVPEPVRDHVGTVIGALVAAGTAEDPRRQVETAPTA